MLFTDYSSAFNTIIPSKLIIKLGGLGLKPGMCIWVLDFMTGRHQLVKVGNKTSTMLILKSIVKFADNTTVVDLISYNDESAYREEMKGPGRVVPGK